MSAHLICSGCYRRTKEFAMVKRDKSGLCLKCSRKTFVVDRPKGMNWRTAFWNIVKHGTYTPKENNIPNPIPAPAGTTKG